MCVHVYMSENMCLTLTAYIYLCQCVCKLPLLLSVLVAMTPAWGTCRGLTVCPDLWPHKALTFVTWVSCGLTLYLTVYLDTTADREKKNESLQTDNISMVKSAIHKVQVHKEALCGHPVDLLRDNPYYRCDNVKERNNNNNNEPYI